MSIRTGYMGLADIGGTNVRCNSFTVNPNQDILFYNHVIGLKDTIPADNSTKTEDLGLTYANVQRKIWRPSPISITGGISFPATKKNLSNIFDLARYANYFDTNFTYFCHATEKNTREFIDCRINSFDFSIVAGDIVNISLDVACKNIKFDLNKYISYTEAEKLITWDKVPVKIENASFTSNNMIIQGFNFKINNNLQTIYTTTSETNKTESLLPTDIRVGMQEVTGSVAIYYDRGYEFVPIDLNTVANIKANMGDAGINLDMTVVFKPHQFEGNVGPLLVQLPFVCVDYSFQ